MNGFLHTVVLVEDNIDDEALSLRAISKSGVNCDVTVLRHGSEAVSYLISDLGPVPELIVLDFHLPGCNGLDIVRELRKQERTRHLPIVMLSSLQSPREMKACLEEGANSCVQKMFDAELYTEYIALTVKYWLTVHEHPEREESA